MEDHFEITSPYDQQRVGAIHLLPSGVRLGGLVLLQEIFGLDEHMLRDAARWAQLGYEVIAPSLFDRCQKGYCAAHDGGGVHRGMACLKATPDDQALGDIAACVDMLAASGPVFVLGYCYGGRLAWLAAARVQRVSAAVTYYGNVLAQMEQVPQCPVMLHFGGQDPHLPVADIAAAVKLRHPGAELHVYPESGHGFNNQGAPGARAEDAQTARLRTRAFFERLRA